MAAVAAARMPEPGGRHHRPDGASLEPLERIPLPAEPLDDPAEHPAPSARELRIQLRSGRLCLDFLATLGEWDGRRFERIVDSDQWLCWLGRARVAAPPAVTEGDLREMRELRESAHRVIAGVVGGDGIPSDALAVVNRFALVSPPPPQIDDDGFSLKRVAQQRPDEALSVIARDLIDLLSGPLHGRIRKCADPGCEFFFADGSRPGSRRWCTSCGAATASARYRRRRSRSMAG